VSALLRRVWRALERLAEGRWATPSLLAAALLAYVLVSVAIPLAAGRDFGRYLVVYAQLFDSPVVYPFSLASRPPGTAFVAGPLLEGGPLVAEAGTALLYAVSVLAWCAVARRFGPAAAIATAVALLLYPGYVLLFHRLSSDAVFAAGFALVALLVARAAERPSAGRAVALGAGVAALVLIRPTGQALLLLAFLPLLAATSWRGRVQGVAAFAVAAAIPLAAWAGHNAVRADDLTIARGSGSTFPLFRAFVADRIVRPGNGPASAELARVVTRRLLPFEPYRSYGVDIDEFFSSGSARMHEDLIGLSDRTWGWDDDYRHLARVGREAVLAHPFAYARGVADDLWELLLWPLYVDVGDGGAARASATTRTLAASVQELPTPSEGEPIPAARQSAHITTPHGRIREVWTSPTEHQVVFVDPADAARAAQIDRRIDELAAGFPDRAGRPEIADWLNRASRWYPRPFMWLLVGLLAVALRRPARMLVPLTLAGAALLVLLGTALAVYAVAEYTVPVAPAFVLLATAGVLGRYRPVRGSPAAHPRA
jgi:Dolichyl-phosphate-mannose-protein mannosyltransferase